LRKSIFSVKKHTNVIAIYTSEEKKLGSAHWVLSENQRVRDERIARLPLCLKEIRPILQVGVFLIIK
jgi:hypothetical protein